MLFAVMFRPVNRAFCSRCNRLHHQSQRANRSLQSPQKPPSPHYHLKSDLAPCHPRPTPPLCLRWTSSSQTPSLTVSPLKCLKFSQQLKNEESCRKDHFVQIWSRFSFADDPFKDDPFGKADVAGELNRVLEVMNRQTNLLHINQNLIKCIWWVHSNKHEHTVSVAGFVQSDPFGGDPFKGTDPFAADSFFTQTSSAPFSSEDPFTASADPFGTTTGMPEPDLFAAKVNDAAAAPAEDPDPFVSKPTNPALAAKDPFSSTGNHTSDSDPFGGKMNATGEADPFGSQDGGTDPFQCSPPSSDLAVVSRTTDNALICPTKIWYVVFYMLSVNLNL